MGISLLYFALLSRGLAGDLPYVPEADEVIFVPIALRMAMTPTLDPGWFGNPGATLIYPLAAVFWLQAHGLGWPMPSPVDTSTAAFSPEHAQLYMIGRWLSIPFAILALWPIYAVGLNIAGRRAALLAAALGLLYPVIVLHVQIVRTDAAGIFFGMTALWLCLRADIRPGIPRQIAAGLACGLAVATRYFLVVLLLVNILGSLWPAKDHGTVPIARRLVLVGSSGLAAALGFLLSSPYANLRWPLTLQNLATEARAQQLGFDGLSRFGNLNWYLFDALPATMGRYQALLLLVGVAVALFGRWSGRKRSSILALAYVGLSLLAFSTSALHWQRWLIQILPVLSIFVALALVWITDRLASYRLSWARYSSLILLALATPALAPGLPESIVHVRARSRTSTRVEARLWLEDALQGTDAKRVAQEPFSLAGASQAYEGVDIEDATRYGSLDDWTDQGFDYLVLSQWTWGHYLTDPERYPSQASFYQELFESEQAQAHFIPAHLSEGPEIHIYALGKRSEAP